VGGADANIRGDITEAEDSQHELAVVLQHLDVGVRELIEARLACVETVSGSGHNLLMIDGIIVDPLPSAASHQREDREEQNQDSHFRIRLTSA
jgi:hypothetical protein